MSVVSFVEKLQENPKSITFQETIQVIEENYDFMPTAFKTEINKIMPEKITVLVKYSPLQNCKTFQKKRL